MSTKDRKERFVTLVSTYRVSIGNRKFGKYTNFKQKKTTHNTGKSREDSRSRPQNIMDLKEFKTKKINHEEEIIISMDLYEITTQPLNPHTIPSLIHNLRLKNLNGIISKHKQVTKKRKTHRSLNHCTNSTIQ